MKAVDWFTRLLELLRQSYQVASRETIARNSWPVTKWDVFKRLFTVTMEWTDIAAASSLRERANSEQLQMHTFIRPPTLEAAIDILKMVEERNPWVVDHTLSMTPIIQARTAAILESERVFYASYKMKTIPAYRFDLQYRGAISAIANTSQQLELAIPDVGRHFPFSLYKTRDDARVRPTHAVMNGFVAQKEWGGWGKCVPPNGFNCRCYLVYMTYAESKKRGWLTEGGKPRFIARWPNSASKHNFYSRAFPDIGWDGPKIVAAPVSDVALV